MQIAIYLVALRQAIRLAVDPRAVCGFFVGTGHTTSEGGKPTRIQQSFVEFSRILDIYSTF